MTIMRRIAAALLTPGLLAAPATASARQVAPHAAEAARTEAYLTERMKRFGIPGMQVAVVKDGRIVLLRSFGIGNVELNTPVTDSTLFAVNSVTKAFTGLEATRLARQGKLDLAAPIGRYVPDLPASWRAIPLRQLLTHMSGLPDVIGAPTVETDDAAAWAWVKQQPLRFQPGERFDYCQTNYTLLQQAMNAVQGKPLVTPPALPQFEIAGMVNSRFGDSTELVMGKVPSYSRRRDGALYPRTERFLPSRRASSGLNTTAEDMAKWILAIEDGRLIDAEGRATLWKTVAFNSGREGRWSMGWQILKRGSHRAAGMTGGSRAAFYVYPEDRVAVVILTNLAGAYPEDMVDQVAAFYAPNLPLEGVAALRIQLDAQGYQRAPEVAAALAQADPALVWQEAELNDWGYRLLNSPRLAEGLEVMKLTASLFPDSSNAQDSLGDAYARNGKRDEALSHYRKALALDPANAHAATQVKRLEGDATPNPR